MTQDENLELSHQHPLSAAAAIDGNNNIISSSDQQQHQQQNEQQQQLHESEIHDDLNKSKITHTDSNSTDNNCNSKCICDDNTKEEIINPLISDILIGISDNLNYTAKDITLQIKEAKNEIINNLPKSSIELNSVENDFNNITSIEVVQLNETDIKIESVSPTSTIDNNNHNNYVEEKPYIVDNHIKFITANIPKHLEDIKFTTIIKNENNFENIRDIEINFGENIEIKNLDNVTGSVIDEQQINALTNSVVFNNDKINNSIANTVGILNDLNLTNNCEDFINNEQIELKENCEKINKEFEEENKANNENLKENSKEINDENKNSNIVIDDENRTFELKNQGDFITNDINLIKSVNNNIDAKQLTVDNFNENKLRRKSDEKLKEDPIERLNKLRANITNALREVKGVIKQYSNSEKSIDLVEDNTNYNQMAPVTDDSAAVQFRFVRKIRRRSHLSDDDINEVDISNNKLNNNNNELIVNKHLDNIPEIKSEKSVEVKLEAKLFKEIEKEFDKKNSEVVNDKKSDIILEIKSENFVKNCEINNAAVLKKDSLKNNLDKTNIDLTKPSEVVTNDNLDEKTKKKLKKSISIATDENISEQKTVKKKLKKQSSVDNEIKVLPITNVDGKLKKRLKKTESLDKTITKDIIISEDKSKKIKVKKQNSIDNGNKCVKPEATTLTKKILKKQAAISITDTTNNKVIEIKNDATKISKIPVSINRIDKTVSVHKAELKSENSVKHNSSENQAIEKIIKSSKDIESSISENPSRTSNLLIESKALNHSSQLTTADIIKTPKIALLNKVEQLLKKPKEKIETLSKEVESENSEALKTEEKAAIPLIATKLPTTKTEIENVKQGKVIENKPKQPNSSGETSRNNSSDTKNEKKNLSLKTVEIVSKNCLLSEVEKLLKTSVPKNQEAPNTSPKMSTASKTDSEISSNKESKEITEIAKPEVTAVPGKNIAVEKSPPQITSEASLKTSVVGKSVSQNTAVQKQSATVGKKDIKTSSNDKDKTAPSSKSSSPHVNKSSTPVPNKATSKTSQQAKIESNPTKAVSNASNSVVSLRQDSSPVNKLATNTTVVPLDTMPPINKSETNIVPVANSTNAPEQGKDIANKSSLTAIDAIQSAIESTIVTVDPVVNSLNSKSVPAEETKTINKSDVIAIVKDVKEAVNISNSVITSKDVKQDECILNSQSPVDVKQNSSTAESLKEPEISKHVFDISAAELNNIENQSDSKSPQENINLSSEDLNLKKDEASSQSNVTGDTKNDEEDVPVSLHVPKDDFARKIGTLGKDGHTHSATETETENDEEEKPTRDKVKEPKKRRASKKVVIRRVKRKLSIAEGFAQAPLPEAETEICEKEIFKGDETTESGTAAVEAEEEIPKEKPKPKSCLKVRAYEPGDLVMYADRVKKTQVKWRLATVVERITSISYKLNIEGEEKTCHLSYIKKHTNKKLSFGGKEYLEIDYAQIEADEEEEKNYSIWNLV